MDYFFISYYFIYLIAQLAPHWWDIFFTQQTSYLPHAFLITTLWYIGICKGIPLESGLVMWVGSHLRANILPITLTLSPSFLFCDMLCDSCKTIIGQCVNICQVPFSWCLDDLVV